MTSKSRSIVIKTGISFHGISLAADVKLELLQKFPIVKDFASVLHLNAQIQVECPVEIAIY